MGYFYQPFSFPLVLQPILYAGVFFDHRWNDVGNSDYHPGIATMPALSMRYNINPRIDACMEIGYAFSYTSSYATRTAQIMAGVDYRLSLNTENDNIVNEMEKAKKQ